MGNYLHGHPCICTELMAHHDSPDVRCMAISACHGKCPDAEILASPETVGEATQIHTASTQQGNSVT